MTGALRDALRVLGVEPGATLRDVRARYRVLLRATHPDVAGRADATERTAGLTNAFAVVRDAVRDDGHGVVPDPDRPAARPPSRPSATAAPRPGPDARRTAGRDVADDEEAERIVIAAAPVEAYALLLEAASAIGAIGYVDRRLGLLEVVVRFAGGPTCSVLVIVEPRGSTTEAKCTMESIEAAPTPPLAPVVEALLETLRTLHPDR